MTTYTFNGGADVQLKLTAGRTIELEDKLGDSLQAKLAEIDKISVAAEYVAAAITEGDYKTRKETALAIYDDMVESGKVLADYHELILKVLVSAGFLRAADVERQIETTKAAQKLQEITQKTSIQMISEKIDKLEKNTATTAN